VGILIITGAWGMRVLGGVPRLATKEVFGDEKERRRRLSGRKIKKKR